MMSKILNDSFHLATSCRCASVCREGFTFPGSDALTEIISSTVRRRLISDELRAWTAADYHLCTVSTLRPTQNGFLFAEDNFKWISLNEIFVFFVYFIEIFPYVSNLQLTNILSANGWRHTCDQAISEPILTQFSDAYMHHLHPQWVHTFWNLIDYFEWRQTLKDRYKISSNIS